MGQSPFQLDSKAPKIPLKEYAYNEARYRMLATSNPEAAAAFMETAQKDIDQRWKRYEQLAAAGMAGGDGAGSGDDRAHAVTKQPLPPARPPGVRPAPPPDVRPGGPHVAGKPMATKLPPGRRGK